MFNNYSETSYSKKSCVDGSKKTREKILNSKIYYLNKSSSKFVGVGLSLCDFTPLIQIGGQNGFSVFLNEEEWSNLLKYQGVIANFFYFDNSDSQHITFGDIKISFERNPWSIIKIQKGDSYVCFASETSDGLWLLKDLIEYRIDMIKKQGFDIYFNHLQNNFLSTGNDFLTKIYNIINHNQNPNSENVSTILEMMSLYPEELENKLKKQGSKRKYYEEISDY